MFYKKKSYEITPSCVSIIQSGNLKKLKRCIPDLARDKSWVGSNKLSPLHIAAGCNQVEICKFLLEEGITPDVTEPFTGKTPMHIAAYHGYMEIAEVLSHFGGDINTPDCLECYPIHYAAMGCQKHMILYFVENRISPALQSIFGNILDILIRKKQDNLVEFFASVSGIEAFDSYYKQYDSPLRSISDQEWTPFHSAIVSGQQNIFKALMEQFPHAPAIKNPASSFDKLESSTTVAYLATLEGSMGIQKLLGIDQNTHKFRKQFMKINWYETGFAKRKKLCEAIRYRDTHSLKKLIEKQGLDTIFQREKKNRQESLFMSLEKPNALDFATYMYSLPFFDYLITNKVEIPSSEFSIRQRDLFFNWALMEVHPYGEAFLKTMKTEGVYGKNCSD